MRRPHDLASRSGNPVGRRTFLAATLAAAAAGATGCGFGDDEGGSEPGDDGSPQGDVTLRQSMLPVTHLDPAVNANSSFGQIMMVGLWEGLVTQNVDDSLDVAPGVAESWDISEDMLTYTFHLRANAKWSNGDPVTAQDFLWNWQRILTPGVAGEASPSYAHPRVGVAGALAYMNGETDDFSTVGVTAVDEATFEITLEWPNPDFLLRFAGFWSLPLHPATVEELGDAWLDPANWVSNGAFVLDDFRVNDGAVLLPNEEYWDKDSYHIDRWEVTFNDGGTTSDLLAYQDNTVDITGRIEEDIEAVTTSDVGDELIVSPNTQVRKLVVMNSRNPTLHDIRVRQALSMAIDREALGEVARPAVPGNSLLPDDVEGGDQVPGVEFDVEGARALLESAGYPGGEGMPTIQLLDFQNSSWVEVIAQMWSDNLGVNATPDIVEIGIYGERYRELHAEDYTGFFVTNSAVSPPTLLFSAQSTAVAWNIYGFNLVPADVAEEFKAAEADGATPPELLAILDGKRYPEAHEAIDLADAGLAETDPDAQTDLFVQGAIARDNAFMEIPVLWGGYTLLVKPKVKNLKPWPYSSVFTLKDVTIEE